MITAYTNCKNCNHNFLSSEIFKICPSCKHQNVKANNIPYSKRDYKKIEVTLTKSTQGQKPDLSDIEIDFSKIIGYKNIKEILTDSVRSKKPVHVLLHGPSGCGKTELLQAIENTIPNYFMMASNSGTKAGFGEQLKNKRPFFVGIDELEKWKKQDLESLFMLMSNGRYIKITKTEYYDISLECSIFATCNDLLKLKRTVEPLVDRFVVLSMDDLTQEQFLDIGIPMLIKKYGFSEEFAGLLVWSVINNLNMKLRTLNKLASLVMANPTEDNLTRKVNILAEFKSKI